MPKVSVILTSFNHGAFIAEAIESVLRQSFTDFELFIWDDASSDESWAVIQRYTDPRIHAFRNPEPLRAIHGVNKVITELAKGKYIAMHHSDDVWEADKLARQVQFLDAHPGAGAVFSNALAIDEQGGEADPGHFYATIFDQPNRSRFEWLNHFFFRGNALCHPSAMVRRRCYGELGPYRYGFAQVGDLDMWVRLCFRYEIHVLPEKLVRFRVHAAERNTSGSRPETRVRWVTEMYRLLRNYLRIETWEEMVAIFPQARKYHQPAGFDAQFVLAMIALDEHPFHFTKLFGIELLFDLLSDPSKAQAIQRLYGFDYRDLIALTAQHDVFSHEHGALLAQNLKASSERVAALEASAAQYEADLDHMHKAVAARNEQLATAHAEHSVLRQRVGELDGALASKLSEADELRRILENQALSVSSLEQTLAAMRDQAQRAEATIKAQASRLDEAVEQAQRAQRELAHLQHAVKQLRGSLAERDEELGMLRRESQARAADLDHMHKVVAQRDKRLLEQQAAIAQRDRSIEQIERKQRLFEKEAFKLGNQVESLRESWAVRLDQVIVEPLRKQLMLAKARRWKAELAKCPLVDPAWYLANNADVAASGADPVVHYLTMGWQEGRDAGPGFDGRYYIRRYPDVAAAGMPPLVHYWLHGRHEKRHPTKAAEDSHRRLQRLHRRLLRCPLFDAGWYLRKYPDVAASGDDPAWHYVEHGWKEDRQPGPEFDVHFYRRRYPDVIHHDSPLLLHFWRQGRFEGRLPHEALDFEALQALPPVILPSDEIEVDPAEFEGRQAPYITVIIPTYNRVERLPGLVESWRAVAAQTRFPFEILFSDDGSTDNTVEYLEAVRGLPLRVLKNEHGGPSRARNAAVRASAGERLLFMGDDIYPEPDILNVHAALTQRLGAHVATLGIVDWHPGLAVNHLMHHITDVGNEQFSFNRLPDGGFTDFRHFYTCNVCLDRELVMAEERVFDERFERAAFEDVEFAYRMALRGMKLLYTSRARGTHWHPYAVEGFCRRQAGSGEMAAIFVEMHPAADHFLRTAELRRAARRSRGQADRTPLWLSRLETLKVRCNHYESMVAALPAELGRGLRERLSTVYAHLFKAMFEFGVLQKLGRYPNALEVAMARNFDASWDLYWAALEKAPEAWRPNPIELHDLACALSRGGAERSYGGAFRAALAELRAVRPRDVGRFPHASKDLTIPEGGRPGIVLDADAAWPSLAVARFRDAFGEGAAAYRWTDDRVLRELDREGRVVESSSPRDTDVLYWPTSAETMLARDHLQDGWLAVVENGCGMAVVSHSLERTEAVRVGRPRDHIWFSAELAAAFAAGHLGSLAFSGRILRLMPAARGDFVELKLGELLGCDLDVRPDGSFHSRVAQAPPRRWNEAKTGARIKDKPVVFVFPIFIAVGGVERLLIEIMRELRDRFDFVVVTMERLRPEQGSLAAQAMEVATRVVDMAEIAEPASFLGILTRLREVYRPDLVWVCNGSPWFCDNAGEIRHVFRGIPIVDQEVYDTREGWINRYDEPGIRSFDYFVAINRKIERRFIDDFGLPPERVRQIYHAFDARRIRAFRSATHDLAALREKFGLPEGKRIFACVARLTHQKRPLAFLDLARRRRDRGDECFVLVGDGELAPQVDEYIATHGVDVVRVPFVANIFEFFVLADGIVFTSAYEGLPIAMLEALAMGVPVFSTDVGDVAEVLGDYQAGLVVPVDSSPEAVADAFDQWVQRHATYADGARKAQEAVLERFSSATVAAQYEACWRDAMALYRPRQPEAVREGAQTLVSVVIPSYNHAAYIAAAVDSVLRQTHSNLELIVVDDGSTDGTREYLRGISDPRCRIIEQPNAGAHAAINRGLQLARGEVLAILNSDDIFHPRRLQTCLEELHREDCDLVASWLEVIDESGKVLGVKQGWHNMLPWPVQRPGHSIADLDEFASNLLLSNFVSTTSNVVFTRRLYERVGGMRNLRFVHDWDFLIRAAREFRCRLLEQPLLQYRIHGSNTISSNRAWMLFEICWVYAVALRRLVGGSLYRGEAVDQLVRDVRDVAGAINLQGNDKIMWMIDTFISAREAAGDGNAEELLLEDRALREAFIGYVAT